MRDTERLRKKLRKRAGGHCRFDMSDRHAEQLEDIERELLRLQTEASRLHGIVDSACSAINAIRSAQAELAGLAFKSVLAGGHGSRRPAGPTQTENTPYIIVDTPLGVTIGIDRSKPVGGSITHVGLLTTPQLFRHHLFVCQTYIVHIWTVYFFPGVGFGNSSDMKMSVNGEGANTFITWQVPPEAPTEMWGTPHMIDPATRRPRRSHEGIRKRSSQGSLMSARGGPYRMRSGSLDLQLG